MAASSTHGRFSGISWTLSVTKQSLFSCFKSQTLYDNCLNKLFVIVIVIVMYRSQKMQGRWGEIASSQFSVSNGVKQGGVMSPVLFTCTVYLDNLLKILKQRNIGCKIGATYLGVFGYADDLTLLCPSISGLKEMLKISGDYASDYNIIFNTKKIKLMHFGRNKMNIKNTISRANGCPIDYVEQCVHLGTIIHSDITRKNIDSAVNDLFMRTNNLIADFFIPIVVHCLFY